MNKKGKIIAAFPCVGKTHFVLNNFISISCVDHDFYDYMYRGNLGNNWLAHYIYRMEELQNKFDYVLINATPEILKALKELQINATVVYPDITLKKEWIDRAIKRGGATQFPKLLEQNWDYWILCCNMWEGEKVSIKENEHLSDLSYFILNK